MILGYLLIPSALLYLISPIVSNGRCQFCRCVTDKLKMMKNFHHQYLLLHGPSSAFGQLAVVVHGGCSAPRRLSVFAALRIQHPPGAFSCSLVLDAYKSAVKRQIVSYRVLQEGETKPKHAAVSNGVQSNIAFIFNDTVSCRSLSLNGSGINIWDLARVVVVNILKVMF